MLSYPYRYLLTSKTRWQYRYLSLIRWTKILPKIQETLPEPIRVTYQLLGGRQLTIDANLNGWIITITTATNAYPALVFVNMVRLLIGFSYISCLIYDHINPRYRYVSIWTVAINAHNMNQPRLMTTPKEIDRQLYFQFHEMRGLKQTHITILTTLLFDLWRLKSSFSGLQ